MRNILLALVFALCVALPAHADTAEYRAQQLARFEKYAGVPIQRFPLVDIWQWQVVGDLQVVIWPTVNTAYLITLDKPCRNLTWSNTMGITQNTSMHVDAKFDSIFFEHQTCRIHEIRPIDYKALRADEAAAKPASDVPR